ncbi:hypothetical protein Glove_161g17 [Diversispora epigaea]|uniref:Uncharacterized protein n=1 Tax=Diversispora epigaea TaxID=1348612 RepID=A0A397J0E8_9GLOM|nr:hypothetical protein Glove_161g17 [Diversispora epigaea]
MLSDIKNPGSNFEYFIITPCQDWDAVQYLELWSNSNISLDKATTKRSFDIQIQLIKEQGTEEEKKNAIRLENQFKGESKRRGSIDNFWKNHISKSKKKNFEQMNAENVTLSISSCEQVQIGGAGNAQVHKRIQPDIKEQIENRKVFTGINNNLDAKPIIKRNRDEKNSDGKINKKPHLMKSNQNDSLILKSADSKINQENQSLCSLPSNINCEDIEPEYYDASKRIKIIYSWEDAIDKIDFRNISKKDWIFENYNLSNEFRDFQKMTIQQAKEKPYLCYKKDIQKILCLSNIMLIERIKPTYLSCNLASWNTICRRKTSSYLPPVVNNVILEYSLLLNSFTPLEEMEDRWCENFSRVTELNKEDRANFCKCQIILRNFFLLGSINKDNEDTFVHSTLHNLINEIFRDPMLELVWANSESSASKSRRLNNKENVTVKGNKPDFKISTNTKDEVLFGEVKPRDSFSVLVKKDLVKLAEFQAGTLDELTKKYGNRIGMISFGIWICGEHIRVYEMDLNYDGIYRMILVADVCVPIEREKIVGFLPVLEAFYNVKHRISELLTVIASNTPPGSPSRSSYGRMPTPSPKPVRVAITGLQPN